MTVEKLRALIDASEEQRRLLTTVAFRRLVDQQDRLALDQIHQLVRTPADIRVLEQAILALAVSGKLVPQIPSEGTAEELLRQLAGDAGVSRKVKNPDRQRRTAVAPSFVEVKHPPIQLPRQWKWASLNQIVTNLDWARVPLSQEHRAVRRGAYDYYGASGVIDSIDDYLFEGNLLLVGEDGANLLRRSSPIAFLARGKYWVNNHAHVLDALHDEILEYLALFLNATDLTAYVTGTAQPKMNQAKMNSIPIALPPLGEQKRIVTRVRELLGRTDSLKATLAS